MCIQSTTGRKFYRTNTKARYTVRLPHSYFFFMLQIACVHKETPAVACLFREAEIDKTEMYHCFRPGDIVRAEVRVIIVIYVIPARLPLHFASFCYSIVIGFGAGNFSRGLEVVLSFNSKKSSRSGGRQE